MIVKNTIQINAPYVNYTQVVQLETVEHIFRVSIVNLLNDNIEPDLNNDGYPFYILKNPKTGKEIEVYLQSADGSTKTYQNTQNSKINSSLNIILIVS